MTDRHTLQRGELHLSVRVEGLADKPWLLALHSVATSRAMRDACRPALTRTHRVLVCDARGHGPSEALPGLYAFDDLVGDLMAVLDHSGIAHCGVLGLSMGGMTALGLALDHPERVDRLVCANARAAVPPALAAAWAVRAAALASGGMAAIAEKTLARWFSAAALAEQPGIVDVARQMILTTKPKGYRGCAAALERLDYQSQLAGIGAPVLFLAGAADVAAPPAAMAEMAAGTPLG